MSNSFKVIAVAAVLFVSLDNVAQAQTIGGGSTGVGGASRIGSLHANGTQSVGTLNNTRATQKQPQIVTYPKSEPDPTPDFVWLPKPKFEPEFPHKFVWPPKGPDPRLIDQARRTFGKEFPRSAVNYGG